MRFIVLALWLLVSTVAISAEQIRIIVPFPPGGPNDYFARLISQELSGVVENITGAGGMIAAERVANIKRIENTSLSFILAPFRDNYGDIRTRSIIFYVITQRVWK